MATSVNLTKFVSNSPALVDFAVGLVDFTLNLPKGQVKSLGEICFEEIQASWKIEFLCTLIKHNKCLTTEQLTIKHSITQLSAIKLIDVFLVSFWGEPCPDWSPLGVKFKIFNRHTLCVLYESLPHK